MIFFGFFGFCFVVVVAVQIFANCCSQWLCLEVFRGLFLLGSRQILLVASESISSLHFPSSLASVLTTKVKSVWFSHSACCISGTLKVRLSLDGKCLVNF